MHEHTNFIWEKQKKNFEGNIQTIAFVKKYTFSNQNRHLSNPQTPYSSTVFIILENCSAKSRATNTRAHKYTSMALSSKLLPGNSGVKTPIAEGLRLRERNQIFEFVSWKLFAFMSSTRSFLT